MRYIHQVTLQTGHVARQYRRDVSAEAVAAISEMLDSLLTGGRPSVPGQPDFRAHGTHIGPALVVTLCTGRRDAPVPVLTTMTCLKSRASRGAWEAIHQGVLMPCVTDPSRPPPAPWTADRLEPGYLPLAEGAVLRGENSLWTGDFARCVAWAWVAYSRER